MFEYCHVMLFTTNIIILTKALNNIGWGIVAQDPFLWYCCTGLFSLKFKDNFIEMQSKCIFIIGSLHY